MQAMSKMLYFDLVGDTAAKHKGNWSAFIKKGSQLWRKTYDYVISKVEKNLVVR